MYQTQYYLKAGLRKHFYYNTKKVKKTIKSLICAASAAVICAAPIAPTFAGLSPVTGITAEAATATPATASFYKTIDGDKYYSASGLIFKDNNDGTVSIAAISKANASIVAPAAIKYGSKN